ncbi:hypothetical protein HK405_007098 [Cladochytrium tenue]|nr:hypothetical protein HK405_007098 [Cladochytrium tenue]
MPVPQPPAISAAQVDASNNSRPSAGPRVPSIIGPFNSDGVPHPQPPSLAPAGNPSNRRRSLRGNHPLSKEMGNVKDLCQQLQSFSQAQRRSNVLRSLRDLSELKRLSDGIRHREELAAAESDVAAAVINPVIRRQILRGRAAKHMANEAGKLASDG